MTLTALRFDVTCRSCGGELEVVNPGTHTEVASKAVVACAACRKEYLITVRMDWFTQPVEVRRGPRSILPTDLVCPKSGAKAECGTETGYRRGCREDECRAAHAAAERQRLERKRRRAAA